jgi:lysyl-tRNA synthetase class 2
VPGDPTSLRPLVTGLAVALAAWAVVGSTSDAHTNRITDLGFEVAIAAGAFWALHQWLRAHREPLEQTDADHERARGLVAEHGDDSLSFFALRADRRYTFSRAGNAFLAYRVVAGCALVAGDPIGADDEIPGLVEDFGALCRERGWRMVVLHASARWLHLYRRRGMRAVAIGDEAIIRPAAFTLDGRAMRKVRQSVTRLRKAGYDVRVLAPSELSRPRRAEIERVSAEWRGRSAERGFSMAMDDLYAHEPARFAVAFDAAGAVRGFLHLVPSSSGYSLSAMRRGLGTPNGLMEFLLCETFAWAGARRIERVSLNFNAFGDLLRSDARLPAWERGLRFALARADRFFQVERLLAFNRKFLPAWEPRYAAFERYSDLPLAALVLLSMESLVAWPGILRRLWPHASPVPSAPPARRVA